MRDKDLVLEVLRQIGQASEKILSRFQPIAKVSDFTDSPAGTKSRPSYRPPGKL